MQLDPEKKKRFDVILNQKEEIRELQETLKDGVNNLAKELGTKPAVVNRILRLVEQERATGGVLQSFRDIIETAEEVE